MAENLNFRKKYNFCSNILRLTIECQNKTGEVYKVYINGEFHTDIPAAGFVPDQYRVEMVGTTDAGGVWKGQAEWFTLEFR